MTISSIDTIVDRIETATPESPIAVFVEYDGEKPRLNAVFASTVASKQRLADSDSGLVGVFDKRIERKVLRAALVGAISKP